MPDYSYEIAYLTRQLDAMDARDTSIELDPIEFRAMGELGETRILIMPMRL